MVLDLKNFKLGDTIQNEKTKQVFIITKHEAVNNHLIELTNLKTPHESKEFIVSGDNPITLRTGNGGEVCTSFTEIPIETLEKFVLSPNEMDTLRSINQDLLNKKDKAFLEKV